MKSFMSTSVNWDSEHTVVGFRLNDRGLGASSNPNWERDLDISVKRRIERSHLFVGFMTTNKNMESVLNEWYYAQSAGIPNLLLVEDVVPISKPLDGNIIIFNRKNPKNAVNLIKKRMEMTLPSMTLKREDVIAWTLGGDALIDILEWFEINAKQEKQQREAVAA
jgi:hypothetical protein